MAKILLASEHIAEHLEADDLICRRLGSTCNRFTRNLVVYHVCFAFWIISNVVSLCVLLGILSPVYGLVAILGAGRPIISIFSSHTRLFLRTLWSFELWFLIAQIILMAISLMDIFFYDERCAIAFLLSVNVLTSLFDDAHPSKWGASWPSSTDRSIRQVLRFVGLFGFTALAATLVSGLIVDIQNRELGLGVTKIHLIDFAFQRMATLAIFYAKNIFYTFRYPSRLASNPARLAVSSLRNPAVVVAAAAAEAAAEAEARAGAEEEAEDDQNIYTRSSSSSSSALLDVMEQDQQEREEEQPYVIMPI